MCRLLNSQSLPSSTPGSKQSTPTATRHLRNAHVCIPQHVIMACTFKLAVPTVSSYNVIRLLCDKNHTLTCQNGISSPDAVAVSQGSFGAGSGRIYLNNLFCAGSESSLLGCPRSDLGVEYCSHYNDAGVICAGKALMGRCGKREPSRNWEGGK